MQKTINRQQLAIYWLSIPTDQLASLYSGEMGNVHRTLLNDGIQDEPIGKEERQLAQQLATTVAQGFKHPSSIQSFLGAMLYFKAYQLSINYQDATLPAWFIQDYLKFMFTSPRLFQQRGEALRYYQYMRSWVDFVHHFVSHNPTSQFQQEIVRFCAQNINLIQLYFNNENLRHVFSKRGDIIEFSLKSLGSPVDYTFPLRASGRCKIKVGLIAYQFGPCTETFSMIPLFEHLDRVQFEIILYAFHVNHEPLEQYCQNRVDKVLQLPDDLNHSVQIIRADDLDVLLVGTNIAAVTHPVVLLAAHRLARVQASFINSPVTTGLRHVDYYITGSLLEPNDEGQNHYCERLETLEGTGFCFSYSLEPYSATIQIDRTSLGISGNAVVFISAANFFKLIPELRETWVKILSAVPQAVLVLLPFGPTWTNAYPVEPFIRSIQSILTHYRIDSKRVQFLKTFPNRADVKEALKLGDIYLDSFPYTSTTSLIDALEVGLPTVVSSGGTARSRMSAAILKSISLSDLIARDEEDYIRLAVNLAKRPDLRHQKRQQILQQMQSNPPFLDSRGFAKKIEAALQRMVRGTKK